MTNQLNNIIRPRFTRILTWCPKSLLLMLLPMMASAEAIPYPPYPGAVQSDSYKVTVDGQPVFMHKFLTYDQFN